MNIFIFDRRVRSVENLTGAVGDALKVIAKPSQHKADLEANILLTKALAWSDSCWHGANAKEVRKVLSFAIMERWLGRRPDLQMIESMVRAC